jgi:hypothetical protein
VFRINEYLKHHYHNFVLKAPKIEINIFGNPDDDAKLVLLSVNILRHSPVKQPLPWRASAFLQEMMIQFGGKTPQIHFYRCN